MKSHRENVLKILASAISRANRVGRASWEVTLFPDYIRLNVGNGAVLQLYPNEIVFIVTGRLMRAVPKEKREAFKHNAKYRFVPDAYEGRLAAWIPRTTPSVSFRLSTAAEQWQLQIMAWLLSANRRWLLACHVPTRRSFGSRPAIYGRYREEISSSSAVFLIYFSQSYLAVHIVNQVAEGLFGHAQIYIDWFAIIRPRTT